MGSNPHSKEDIFSISSFIFFEINNDKFIIIIDKKNEIFKKKIKLNIKLLIMD